MPMFSPPNDEGVFAATLDAVERTFTAASTATIEPVELNDGKDDEEALLDRYDTFDQFPIRREGRIIGVLERVIPAVGDVDGQRFRRRELSSDLILPATQPIDALVEALVERPYFLIVCQHGAFALVTRGDLLKLPVQLFAYTIIIHLEQLLSRVIVYKCPATEDWLLRLDKKDREEAFARLAKLKEDGQDPHIVQLMQLSQKVTVVASVCDLNGRSVSELRNVEQLRNQVMHGRDYAENYDQLRRFDRSLKWARAWIQRFVDLLHGKALSQPALTAGGGPS